MSTSTEVRGAVQAIASLLDEHFQRVEASNAKTRNAVRNRGARTEPADAALNRPKRVSSSAGVLAGYSLRESSGAGPAVVNLVDGNDTNGGIVATFRLEANGFETVFFGDRGPSFGYGLVLVVVEGAGELKGAVYLEGAT